jgi:LPXTG-site transpeptidase (sortase) family protein
MRKLIGNVLIFLSVCLLMFIYLPFILAFFPIAVYQPTSNGYYIDVPKIKAVAPIIENVDPWNQTEYEKALKKGVASSKTNPNFLFAHSSLDPWEMTRINTAFLRLGELKNGDEILISRSGRLTKYYVFNKKEVWPNEISYLNQPKEVLILQTCTPIGTSLKRLLIFAKP